MENPFSPKFDSCNACPDAIEVNNCFNNDPRFFTVKVPYAQDRLVFQKKSALVVCKAEPCELPDKRNVPPPPSGKAILRGYFLYESEFNNADAKFKHQQVELVPEQTVLIGDVETDFNDFCQLLQELVTDCSCECK